MALISPHALERAGWKCSLLNPGETEHPVFDCVLVDARTQRKRRRIIAKCYADAAMGSRTFEVMQRLGTGMETLGCAELAMPRALSYDPSSRLLLQECVTGTPYAELLSRDGHAQYLRLAGAALAALHRLPLPPLPAKSIGEHVTELMRPHPLQLAEALPQARTRIEGLVLSLTRVALAWKAAPVAWLHRDFHIKQLILRDGRVWIIDWDLAASGDPALDVGNFLLNLDKHLAHRALAGRLAFIDGYALRGDTGTVRRAVLYEAFNCLRRACKAFRGRRPGWPRDVMERIDAAERRLHAL